VVICLARGADCLHTVQLTPLHPKTPSSLVSFKSRLVLPSWYRLTQLVQEKRPLNDLIICKDLIFFTARSYASAVYVVVVCPSVCMSVRPSVTSRYCIDKTRQIDLVLAWELLS